jgi:hypothetical protein
VLAQQRNAANKAPVSTDINVSYESDPLLARIRALSTQNVANAKTEAEALRKQAIIDSGLVDVGQEIGVDANTIEAARQNPFSTRATIEREAMERGRALDESLNQGNLFYSGFRAQQLSDLARERAEAESVLAGDIRTALGGISQGVLDAEALAAQQEQEVLQQIAAQEQQNIADQAYLDSLAAILNPAPAPATLPQFITDETAAAAQVDPYYYDPYEEDYALALALNPIYGQLGQF